MDKIETEGNALNQNFAFYPYQSVLVKDIINAQEYAWKRGKIFKINVLVLI